ncbi:Odorant receptor 064 [Nylanderia fulva]|uniref:Odorant receptor n=1 Tax=Nylanderia fulva TaxID=613905 RepID=A0A6G1LR62_9HYME|nr:odorant receptor 10a-like [Nylanderia fulva]KAF3054269.1 Odorant receptor 064 [Nylanderia fulva]
MSSPTQWNAETAYVLTLYKYLLGILGLWVLNEENVFSRIRWFISTMVEMTATVSLSLEVIRHCHGYEDAFDAFLSASSSVISISKLLLHRVTWRHKLILVQAIIHDWTFVKTPRSRDIMLKYARTGRFGSLVFFYLGCASCVFLFSSLIFANFDLPWISLEKETYNQTSERRLLLAAYCVFETYTFFAYFFIEVLQTLQILVNCISQCGNDGFFFDLTMHVCGQFEVLRMDFIEINNKQSLSHNKLSILLKKHHRLIDLAHNLQKAYSLVILSQLLMSVMLLCVEGFQLILTLSINNTFAAMKHLLFIVVLLVQLFIYCFAGQTLEFQSQELAYAIYETPWYNFDISVMKDLPLMILRAANPHQLTAGKLLAINFQSFKEILKASASYLSVLRVMLDT